METVVIVSVIIFFAVACTAVYMHEHKATEAKVLAAVQAVNVKAEAHSTTLQSIETTLGNHGITLTSIAAKSDNMITDVEKTKAVQDIEAAVTKALAMRDALLTPAAKA